MATSTEDLTPDAGLQLTEPEAKAALRALDSLREHLERASIAKNTRLAYRQDLLDFFWWCQQHRLDYLPAEETTVLRYIAACSRHRTFLYRRNDRFKLVTRTLSFASIKRRLAAIRFLYRHTGFDHHFCATSHPPTQRILKGISRELGTRPRRKKGLSLSQIQRMVQWLRQRDTAQYSTERQDALNRRDVAILLVSIASGRRRSEIAALEVADLTFTDDGVWILIGRSKGDQEGRGQETYVSRLDSQYCPVTALRHHLGTRLHGPVFERLDHAAVASRMTGNLPKIQGRTISRLIQKCAEAIGLNPAEYGGHTTRRTMATLGNRGGATTKELQMTGGWNSPAALAPYVEPVAQENAEVTQKILG